LNVANALWGQKGYPFQKRFIDITRDEYGAGLMSLDFAEPEGARKAINDWVEKQTKEKIKDLLKKDVLTRDTRLVLTNAIYFKGDWASPFKTDATREGKFHTPGRAIDVPFMSQVGKFNLLEEKNVQVVELPYAGNDLSMVVVVPSRKDGLAEVEKDLTAKTLRGWLEKMQVERVEVQIPRFSLSSEFDLKPTLSEMGMPLAFDRTRANFSGISESKEPLYLSTVVHKAVVEVNEKGTVAAAATGVVIEPRSMPQRIRADRPFLFLIRDKKTESLLFVGRLVAPRKDS